MEPILIILVLGAVAAATFFAMKARKTADALRQANETNADLAQQMASLKEDVSTLQQELHRLGRYQTVADADKEAASIRLEVETWAATTRADASAEALKLKFQAEAAAAVTKADADVFAAKLRQQAETDAAKIVIDARQEASRIVIEAEIEVAKARAEEAVRRAK